MTGSAAIFARKEGDPQGSEEAVSILWRRDDKGLRASWLEERG